MPRSRKPRATSPHAKLLKEHRPYYEQILLSQNGGCAICGRPPSLKRKLDMDHDHKKMHVRGLLCHRCNRALPAWMTPSWLRSAADYLDKGPVCV